MHCNIWVEQLYYFLIPPWQLLFITNWNILSFCLGENICDLCCGESVSHAGTKAMSVLRSGNTMTMWINISEAALISQLQQQKVAEPMVIQLKAQQGHTLMRTRAATPAEACANASSLSLVPNLDESMVDGYSSVQLQPLGLEHKMDEESLRETCLFKGRLRGEPSCHLQPPNRRL